MWQKINSDYVFVYWIAIIILSGTHSQIVDIRIVTIDSPSIIRMPSLLLRQMKYMSNPGGSLNLGGV